MASSAPCRSIQGKGAPPQKKSNISRTKSTHERSTSWGGLVPSSEDARSAAPQGAPCSAASGAALSQVNRRRLTQRDTADSRPALGRPAGTGWTRKGPGWDPVFYHPFARSLAQPTPLEPVTPPTLAGALFFGTAAPMHQMHHLASLKRASSWLNRRRPPHLSRRVTPQPRPGVASPSTPTPSSPVPRGD
jgi:hypothetical protein